MGKQANTIGPIPNPTQRKTCPFCGENTYQLIFETASPSDDLSLLVRCGRCSHPKNLEGEFKSILWV